LRRRYGVYSLLIIIIPLFNQRIFADLLYFNHVDFGLRIW
jgi:hypothetical protein